MSTARSACPLCVSLAIDHLQTASAQASVDYFQCSMCGHVWNVPKGKDEPVRHVTDPRPLRFDKLKSA